MKKKLIIMFIVLICNISSGSQIKDYLIFNEANEFYRKGEYENAKLKFGTLERSYPSSNLVTKHYYNFFMALNYYKLGDLDNAIKYMEKAVYTPTILNGKNFFNLERNYYLGKFHYEKGELELAIPYLKQLINTDFSPIAKEYEAYAFSILKDIDNNYKILYEIKFKNDFSKISLVPLDSLTATAYYFLNRGEYEQGQVVFKYLYKQNRKDKYIITGYLKTLFLSEEYDEILKVTSSMIKENSYSVVFYYRGKAFVKNKSFTIGIENLKKAVKIEGNYSREFFVIDARETIFYSYFALKNYNDLLIFSKSLPFLTDVEETIVIAALMEVENFDMALERSRALFRKSPFSLKTLYFRYFFHSLFSKDEKAFEKSIINEMNTPTIKLASKVISYFVQSLKNYPLANEIDNINSNPEISKLAKIADLKDFDLLNLEMENNSLISTDPTIDKFIRTKLFEKSHNFKAAYENSMDNIATFSRYRNFLPLIFPKYYTEEVALASKKYDVSENLIYTTILLGSRFDSNYSGSMYKLGLMQIPYNPVKVDSYSKLISPLNNIDIGTKNLSTLIKKYDSDLKGIIAYLYGETVLESINFENDDFYFKNISDPTLRENLEVLVKTFLFYKIIYN